MNSIITEITTEIRTLIRRQAGVTLSTQISHSNGCAWLYTTHYISSFNHSYSIAMAMWEILMNGLLGWQLLNSHHASCNYSKFKKKKFLFQIACPLSLHQYTCTLHACVSTIPGTHTLWLAHSPMHAIHTQPHVLPFDGYGSTARYVMLISQAVWQRREGKKNIYNFRLQVRVPRNFRWKSSHDHVKFW